MLVGNCTYSGSINVDVALDPDLNIGVDTTLCEGETLLLDASIPNGIYEWQDGSMNSTLEVSEAGSYSVEVLVGNCTYSGSINVDVALDPDLNIGADTTLCEGETLLLDASIPNGIYEWQDGSTNSTLEVSEAGSYSVEVLVGNCTYSGSINVDVCLLYTSPSPRDRG